MERAVEGGQAAAYLEFGFSAGGRGADFGLAAAPRGRGGGGGGARISNREFSAACAHTATPTPR